MSSTIVTLTPTLPLPLTLTLTLTVHPHPHPNPITYRPFMSSTIVGATSMVQLNDNLAGFGVEWTDDLEEGVQVRYLLITR